MKLVAAARILVPALGAAAIAAYALLAGWVGPLELRGSLEPGSQAFWLAILVSVAGLTILFGGRSQEPSGRPELRKPADLVATQARQSRPASGSEAVTAATGQERRRAA